MQIVTIDWNDADRLPISYDIEYSLSGELIPDADVRFAGRPLIARLRRLVRPASLCIEAWRCR